MNHSEGGAQPVELMKHFSEELLTYIDATLGWSFYTFKDLKDAYDAYMPRRNRDAMTR